MRGTSIQPLAFAGTLLLGALLPGCVTDGDPALDGDDEAAAAQAETGSGSGSGSGSASGFSASNSCVGGNACSARCGWSCDPVPTSVVACTAAKKQSAWSYTQHTYTLEATTFVAASLLGFTLGHHTGLGQLVTTTSVDNRITCGPTGANLEAALPSTSTWTMQPLASNHGRGMDPGRYASYDKVTYTTGTGQPAAYEEAIQLCLGHITDGFCDSQCGNDAYTLPAVSMLMDACPYTGGGPTNLCLVDPAAFTNRRAYGGPAGPTAATQLWWVHALDTAGHGLVVPRFGHNSNNDANADRMMFQQCAAFVADLNASCDLLASSATSCGPDWAKLKAMIDARVRRVCDTQCGGLQRASGATAWVAGGDSDLAISESFAGGAALSKGCCPTRDNGTPDPGCSAASANPAVCGRGAPYACDYLDAPAGWVPGATPCPGWDPYRVSGM